MALKTRFSFIRQLSWRLRRFDTFRVIHSASFDLPRQNCHVGKNHVPSGINSAKFSRFGHGKHLRNVSSSSTQTEYRLEPSGLPVESFHARDIYKEAVNAVEPQHMVKNVLQFDKKSSTLIIEDKSYRVDRNVYVVGFGKAVLGMARATEDVLGEHVVGGILSIPRGQRQILKEKEKGDLLLLPESNIQVYEGGNGHLPDSEAHEAALAIESLLSRRRETDLVIVLISGGGSPLLPTPQDPITLEDLVTMTALLVNKGASVKYVNIVRKNVERLKGGKMVDTAYPAKMVSLIISDMIDEPLNMIASGPTILDEVTAHQCFAILNRFGVRDQMPESIIQHFERQMADEAFTVRNKRPGSMMSVGGINNGATQLLHQERVQNVLVGSNDIACQAAVTRAKELGHLPYVLTTSMGGEARQIGTTLAKLGMFMLMCFDRKMATQLSMLKLELDIIKDGVSKQQINEIITLVDTATNMGRNAIIISGGEGVVNVKGEGIGGRNLEVVLGASMELRRLFDLTQPRPHPSITVLSADTDGEDGPRCPAAGAVITENFDMEASLAGYSSEEFLNNNDSYTLFKNVKGGSHLVVTRMTGTNVMDIQVLIVRNPVSKPK